MESLAEYKGIDFEIMQIFKEIGNSMIIVRMFDVAMVMASKKFTKFEKNNYLLQEIPDSSSEDSGLFDKFMIAIVEHIKLCQATNSVQEKNVKTIFPPKAPPVKAVFFEKIWNALLFLYASDSKPEGSEYSAYPNMYGVSLQASQI